VRSAAALAPSFSAFEADVAAQLAPVRGIERSQLRADWRSLRRPSSRARDSWILAERAFGQLASVCSRSVILASPCRSMRRATFIGLVTAARLADDRQRRSKNVGQDERAVTRHGSRPLKLRLRGSLSRAGPIPVSRLRGPGRNDEELHRTSTLCAV